LKITQFILVASCLIPLGRAQTASSGHSLKVKFDSAQTEITWKVNGLHTIHGTFKLKDGEFVVNSSTGLAEGEILVDATTSHLSGRDKQMEDQVLESNRYPGILFHPTQFKGGFPGEGNRETTADGTFNIHGTDHPLQMPLKLEVSSGTVTATSHFAIPYVAWGLKNPSTFFHPMGKQVEVQIKAKGTIQQVE
jgi:polyisoprenoid-binding protein YceI